MTREDIKGWKMRQTIHGHGKGFFFYVHQCNQNPRLSRKDTYQKRGRSVESVWRVDGIACTDIDDALLKLDTPPVFTAEDIEAMKTVAREGLSAVDYSFLFALNLKGAIDHGDNGLSDIGKAAIE